jgi:selenide,water dikinase
MSTTNIIKLTQYSSGAGCGCKISPSVLKEILATSEDFPPHPALIVGHDSNDDAAVIEDTKGNWIISTTDFFMPIVDDAYDFGKIAATNALSDVYAMGGTPLMAVAILGWPISKLPASEAARVVEGGRFICRMAGIPLAGGHTIESPEPFFGLAVTGTVEREHLRKNNTPQQGDVLFITKPIGLGVITTAAKRGLDASDELQEAISYMCTLNKMGAELARIRGVHAMTDITGFGLIGHLLEMIQSPDLCATLDYASIPVLPAARKWVSQFVYPDMTTKNHSAFSSFVSPLNAEQMLLLNDPQTSGGLLVSVSPEEAHHVAEVMMRFGILEPKPIGQIEQSGEIKISVK